MQLSRAASHFPVNRAAQHAADDEEHDALDEMAISTMAKAWAHPDDYELLKVRCLSQHVSCGRSSAGCHVSACPSQAAAANEMRLDEVGEKF